MALCRQESGESPWEQCTTRVWVRLGVVVFAGTVLAYLFNVYGIQVLGASMAGTYIYSQPFFAATIAIIFLGESLTASKLAAAACIFLGLYLSNKTLKNV